MKSRAEAERRERLEERRSEKRKSQKKEDADARKGRKVAKHCVFPMIWGSGGSKSRLAKAAGAEPAGQMRDEKLHAVVARSTFGSQNVKNTRGSDHFWKLRCRKSARRCGAKHISKWKCTKHTILGPLLEVEMSKKCTPLWREAHFEIKMYNSWANITGFEQVFLLLVYKDVERYKMAWAWTNRKVPFWNQAAGIPPSKTVGRTVSCYHWGSANQKEFAFLVCW